MGQSPQNFGARTAPDKNVCRVMSTFLLLPFFSVNKRLYIFCRAVELTR